MKVIYMVSEYFGPDNEIGAIRFTKIAKYLSRKGHQVIVFTKNKKRTLVDQILLDDTNEIKHHGGTIYAVEAETTRMFDHFMAVTGLFCEDVKNVEKMMYCGRKFARRHWMHILKQDLPKPDVILTTYGDWGGHYLGMKLKKKYGIQVKWIADFRDPMKGIGKTNALLTKCRERYEDTVIKKADVITVIADEMKEHVCNKHNATVYVIKNGFDTEDIERISGDVFEGTKKFHMVYTGTLYTGSKKKYDLIPFFTALSELVQSNRVMAEDLCLHYAGKHFEEFKRQLGENCKGVEVVNHSFVDRKTALLLQKDANVLLLASWNTKEDKGQVTGKIFEYFMMKKPVIALVSGDEPKSVVKKMITGADCGFCYEESTGAEDSRNMKEYFCTVYDAWKSGQTFDFQIREDYVGQFEYYNIANVFENIMNQ